jgi:hypothetical protein
MKVSCVISLHVPRFREQLIRTIYIKHGGQVITGELKFAIHCW